MNELTYWTWLMRGFGGLVDMIRALTRAKIPGTVYVRNELIKVRDILDDAIAEMEVSDG